MQPVTSDSEDELAADLGLEPGLADVATLERRKAAEISDGDEESFFLDTLAEYQWARDAAGLAATTLDRLTKPVLEICEHYGLAPWRLTPRQVVPWPCPLGVGQGSNALVYTRRSGGRSTLKSKRWPLSRWLRHGHQRSHDLRQRG